MVRIREPAPVNTHVNIGKTRNLRVSDCPDFQVVKDFTAGSDGIPQVLMLIGTIIRVLQIFRIIKELLS